MIKMLVAATIPFAALAAGCLQSSPPVGGAPSQLAKACAVTEETAIDLLEPGASLPDTEVEPAPADCEDDTLGAACCDAVDPTKCNPMPLPPDVCFTVPTVADSTIIFPVDFETSVSEVMTQYYDNCAPIPPGTTCNTDDAAHVLHPYPHVRYAITVERDPVTHAVIDTTLYWIPEGTLAVRTEEGDELYPLLDEGDGFANPLAPVATPAGTKYADYQNDCVPRPDGCGFTCTPC
jgi:hypothetical protein